MQRQLRDKRAAATAAEEAQQAAAAAVGTAQAALETAMQGALCTALLERNLQASVGRSVPFHRVSGDRNSERSQSLLFLPDVLFPRRFCAFLVHCSVRSSSAHLVDSLL